MANKSSVLDFGGNTLIVKDIKLADKPGQAGSEEGGLSANPTFGIVTADKIVIDATNDITFPSGADVAAGTGAGSAGHTGGAVATRVIPITIGVTTYYIPLCSTNA